MTISMKMQTVARASVGALRSFLHFRKVYILRSSHISMSYKSRYEKSKTQLLCDDSINILNRDIFSKFFSWEEEKLKRQNGLACLDESSYNTLCGYINMLRNVNNWFNNKPWNQLTQSDIKRVYNDLEDGKIKNRNGNRFEDRRSYYNKIFKSKPFKLAGLHTKVENALEFFTDTRKKDVRFISYDSFQQMLSFLHKPQHFALFWLAWDIGENINSLLEMKVKHLKRQINKDTQEVEYLVYFPKGNLKRSRQTRSEPTLYSETVKYIDALLRYGREIEFHDEKGHFRRKAIPYKDNDYLFTFKYRQALQIFSSVVKRSGVKCEPNGEKPSWKDLRSGMACHLFNQGWHIEDINLRLGHTPQSKWINSYINYLAINRKNVVKKHYNNSLDEIKLELENSKAREKQLSHRLENQGQQLTSLKDEIERLLNGKDFIKVLTNLVRKQRQMANVLEQMTGHKFDVILNNEDEPITTVTLKNIQKRDIPKTKR